MDPQKNGNANELQAYVRGFMEMLLRGYLPLSRIPTNAWLKSRKCTSAVSNRALNMLIFLQVRALTRVNYRSHIYFPIFMHNEQHDIFLAYYSSCFNFRCLVEIKHTHSATI